MSIDIEIYRYELKKYNALRKKVLELLTLLENTINTYEEIGKSLIELYVIDNDTTLVYEKSVELKNKIDDTSKKIKNDILPKINSKIYSLRNEIINYEENNNEE